MWAYEHVYKDEDKMSKNQALLTLISRPRLYHQNL
jgi:hypothetical protein